jgi:hypothetical protein
MAAMAPMLTLEAPGRPESVLDRYAAPTRPRRQGRSEMRQMMIVAAIAAGLVALWLALLPIGS